MGCVVGMATIALSQAPAGGPPPMKPQGRWGMGAMEGEDMPIMRLIKQLDLSKDQKEQMRVIVSGSTNTMRDLHAKMQALAQTQAELFSQDTPDEAAVLKAADEISQVRSAIGKMQIKQMLAIQKILTPEQRVKVRETMKNHLEKRENMVRDHKRMRGEDNKGDRKPEKAPDADAKAVPAACDAAPPPAKAK